MLKYFLPFLALALVGCSSADSGTPAASSTLTISNNPDPAINGGYFSLKTTGQTDSYNVKFYLSIDKSLSNSDIQISSDSCDIVAGCNNGGNVTVTDLFWLSDNTISETSTFTGQPVDTIVTAIPFSGFIIAKVCKFAKSNDCTTTSAQITLN